MIYGIILAGGRGERFWPLSRIARPKQFLKLTSERTMLDETIDRVLPLIPMEQIRIVTGEAMKELIVTAVENIEGINVLSEPVGRNTSTAIGLAAAHLAKEDPDAVMVVLSADHLIRPPEKLLRILKTAANIASEEPSLITIGIVPTRPDTGYGYIKLGDLYRQENSFYIHHVEAFKEKPTAPTAHEYYYSGNYLWNSGMFVWSVAAILEAFKGCHSSLYELLMEYQEHIGTPSETEAKQKLYEKAEAISIDFAVMEKAENVLTIKADIVWDDVGDWRALERYKEMDSDNNVIVGEAVTLESYETTICNEEPGIVACLGVSDLVVVRAGEITLVAHRTKVQDIKKLLAKLSDDEKTSKYL